MPTVAQRAECSQHPSPERSPSVPHRIQPPHARYSRQHSESRQRGSISTLTYGSHTRSQTSPRGSGSSMLNLRPSSLQVPTNRCSSSHRPSTAQNNIHNNRVYARENTKSGTRIRPLANAADQERTSGGRLFGGRLTKVGKGANQPDALVAPDTLLRASAPEFKPGEITPLNTGWAGPDTLQAKRPSKSTAPDLMTRLHKDIENGQYECAICTGDDLGISEVWSCSNCWAVFHLSCIKQWASNSEANARGHAQQTDDIEAPLPWRCPGCNLFQDLKPSSYMCWCGKEHDPHSIIGLPPHSCGQSCGKRRKVPKDCPHLCELVCHAGPCPPCSALGPRQSCFCGKGVSQRKCIDTDYERGWSCAQPCGDLMPCGEHVCPRKCHEGLCGVCTTRMKVKCMCGMEQKELSCSDCSSSQLTKRLCPSDERGYLKEEWLGQFYCNSKCNRVFDCGKHTCSRPCHPSTDLNVHCPRSPDVVTHCPCGKTKLSELLDNPRDSCEDAIPNCAKLCLKTLPCGHLCRQKCHPDTCLPCLQNVDIQCRCKRNTALTICHQGLPEPPQCSRICHATLNCGRHECGERCCQGERKAIQRNASKKKGRLLGLRSHQPLEYFEPEHVCTRVCGRTLTCGQHTCQELCHKGPCTSCSEATFDEVACSCGRTVLKPPLPCGTKPPLCQYDCQRSKLCGHPQVKHNCHTELEPCPSCPFLTEKQCLCGKSRLKNQRCWFQDVRCGKICGKRLKCGIHSCRKTCHRPGDCEDANSKCAQPCARVKKICSHPCEDQCHAPYPCKQERPCPQKLLITCICQVHKEEVRCSASVASNGNLQRQLKCDDECARIERNRKLAEALDIDLSTYTDEHVPYSAGTLKMFSESSKWCMEQEQRFRVFAASDSEKRLHFNPMGSRYRAFLHALAEDYGLDSESMDPEPHRHVAVFKTPRFVRAPSKSLRDAMRIRDAQIQEEERELTTKAKSRAGEDSRAEVTSRETFNGYLLRQARFALTDDEIRTAVSNAQIPNAISPLHSGSNLDFSVRFVSSENVAILTSTVLQPSDGSARLLERALVRAKPALYQSIVARNKLGSSLHLAHFDNDLNVSHCEDQTDSSNVDGWSHVVAKGAPPRFAPIVSAFGEKSGFAILQASPHSSTVLARSKTRAKKDKKRDKQGSVADDWVDALEKEERNLEMRAADEVAASMVSHDVIDHIAAG